MSWSIPVPAGAPAEIRGGLTWIKPELVVYELQRYSDGRMVLIVRVTGPDAERAIGNYWWTLVTPDIAKGTYRADLRYGEPLPSWLPYPEREVAIAEAALAEICQGENR